jgi:peptidoglycan-associated lipoprotein
MNTFLKRHYFLLGGLTAATLFASACSHQKPKTEEPLADSSVADTDLGSSDKGNSLGLETVHFNFDTSTVESSEKSLLKKDAEILRSNPTVKIQIEGHCDARGGIQYNIALGEKRAQSVQHYLEDNGVPASRLSIISYGKERPLDPAQTEEAYKKNRRANLVITAK